MQIDDRPPGLLSRRMFPVDMGRVVVEEEWDVSAPGCPLIRNPWSQAPLEGHRYFRQVKMTREEYEATLPTLFSADEQTDK